MQITNEDEGVSAFWSGRALLRWVEKHQGFYSVQWYHLHKAKHMGISYTVDAGEGEHILYIGIKYLFNWYFCIPMSRQRCKRLEYGRKEWDIRLHSWAIWVDWANDSDSWTCDQAWWLSWRIDFSKLLGDAKYSKEAVHSKYAELCLPDGKHQVRMTKYRHTCKRSRWLTKHWYRIDVEVTDAKGIPCPGKGENSWDCGDNNIQSISIATSSFEKALGAATEDVLFTWQRHGGSYSYKSVEDAGTSVK